MMLGGMLAGHSESGGEIIEKNGKKYKLFYGMSSEVAMKRHAGGVAEYRSESVMLVDKGFMDVWDSLLRIIIVNMFFFFLQSV